MESKMKQCGNQLLDIDIVKDTQYYLHQNLQLFEHKELSKVIREDNSDNGNSKLREKYIVAVSKIIANKNFLLVENGRFYVYCQTHWVEVENGLLLQFIETAIEKIGLSGLNWKYHRFIQDIYSQLQIFSYFFAKQSNKNKVRLNVQNGTVEIDLQNGTVTLMPHDKADGFKYVLNFEFNPKKKAPLFEKIQNENLPDETKQAVLLEYIASIFLSNIHIKLEKVLFLYGSGSNGKSVIFEILQALFGSENITNFSLENLTDNSGYYRALIANKLLNSCSDISKRNTNVGNFKRLASKEPIEARLPYGEPHTISNYASLIFNTNSLPESTDFTDAFFRRFLIIHFDQTIAQDQIDRKLAQKIIDSELPGIFNLIIQALQRLLSQNGFTYSEPIEQALKQYRNETDEVRFWLNESSFEPSKSEFITLQRAYDGYQSFCIGNGYKLRQSNKSEFKNRLLGMSIVVMRKKIGWVVFLTEK